MSDILKRAVMRAGGSTAAHSWLTADRGWVAAGDLRPGEAVVRLGGGTSTVASVQIIPGQADMYNLTVAHDHTYAVGGSQAVVHNTEGPCGDTVYRALRSGENPESGLFPKNPDNPQDILTHVRNSSNPKYPGDQYISTTKDPAVAIQKYAKGDASRVVAIDLSKVGGTITDLSTNEGTLAAGIKWPTPAYNWAMSDKEVLIEGFVPPEAISWYEGG